ncbi:MAG: hypothetical protein ACKO8H_23645, partial [Microcystis panniformis]
KDQLRYIIHMADNIDAILWQLYAACSNRYLNYGARKLCWASITVNKYTFMKHRPTTTDDT